MSNFQLISVWLCLIFVFSSTAIAQEESNPVEIPASLATFDGKRVPKAIKMKPAQDDEITFEIEGELAGDQAGLQLDKNSDEKFPEISEPELEPVQKRPVSAKLVTWKSSDFQHRHLLFEEPEFERHGLGQCSESKQFLLSSKRFFGKALFLPVTTLRGKPWQWQCAPGK